jgi:hypothetical protein
MKFITDYKNLCSACNMVIAEIAAVMPEMPDTDDPEAPFMIASDRGMLCGGRTCKGGFQIGDKVVYQGRLAATLKEFCQHTGRWKIAGTVEAWSYRGDEFPAVDFEGWAKPEELEKE